MNAGTLAGVYRTPAIHVDVTGVFTNTNPVRPYRGNGRPEAAFVIERMVDIAADELGIDPAELRRRNYISPAAMPFKTGLTFTYDCGEFEKNMDLALELADFKGFKARKAQCASGQAARLRPLQHHRTRRRARARKAPKCASTARARLSCSPGRTARARPRDRVQAIGLRPPRPRSRKKCNTSRATPTQVFFGEGTGGSRSATLAGSAFYMATEKIVTRRARSPRICSRSRERSAIRRRRFLDAEDQPHAVGQGNRRRHVRSGQSAARHGARPLRHRDLSGAGQQLSERLPYLEVEIEPTPARSRSCAIPWSTTSASSSTRCCCTARSTAASRKAPARR